MDQKNTVPDAIQDVITAELHRSLHYLIAAQGVPVTHVLAVMHAEIVMQMAALFGGKAAAECIAAASGRVASLPSLASVVAGSKASRGWVQ